MVTRRRPPKRCGCRTCARRSFPPRALSRLSVFLLPAILLLLGTLPFGCRAPEATVKAVQYPVVSSGPATGPLRVLSGNPHYFTDGSGKAIYLVGSHTWSNFLDKGTSDPPPVFDYDGYLKFLLAHNMNFFRLWAWTLTNGGPATQEYEPYAGPYWPWQRVGPGIANDGKPKFDFTRFDQRYFERMRQRIMQAGRQGIYVSVMLFNAFEFHYDLNPADGNAFEGSNNVNGIACEKTCPIDFSLASSTGTWTFEQMYIRKVIDTVNDLDNVLYEVGNEPISPTADTWQGQVVSYVKSYEATKPQQHPVGVNPGIDTPDALLYTLGADWVSPGALVPPPNAALEVVVNDTDHSCYYTCLQRLGHVGQIQWAWKNFTSGNNLLFMDPYLIQWKDRNSPSGECSGGQCRVVDPYWDVLRGALGETRIYAEKINLAAMVPQPRLSSSGFCLANPGSEYLIYKPAPGGWKSYLPWLNRSFTVKLKAGTYSYEWFSPALNKVGAAGTITVGNSGDKLFTAPFSGDSVLWLHK